MCVYIHIQLSFRVWGSSLETHSVCRCVSCIVECRSCSSRIWRRITIRRADLIYLFVPLEFSLFFSILMCFIYFFFLEIIWGIRIVIFHFRGCVKVSFSIESLHYIEVFICNTTQCAAYIYLSWILSTWKNVFLFYQLEVVTRKTAFEYFMVNIVRHSIHTHTLFVIRIVSIRQYTVFLKLFE